MDYQKHYDLLIETRRNRILLDEEYYESHHIIPQSMGGLNDKFNIIKLTAREHFIAHWLLWRIHKNKEMAFAFYAMVNMAKNQKVKSSRVYEEAKMARREFIIENNKKYHKGKKLSDKELERVSLLFKYLIRSDEHKKNISKALTGKPKSDSHKKNLSNSLIGYDWSSHKERNEKISLKNSGSNNGRSRKVRMENESGDVIKVFGTSEEARIFMNSNNGLDIPKVTFWRKIGSDKLFMGYKFFFA